MLNLDQMTPKDRSNMTLDLIVRIGHTMKIQLKEPSDPIERLLEGYDNLGIFAGGNTLIPFCLIESLTYVPGSE